MRKLKIKITIVLLSAVSLPSTGQEICDTLPFIDCSKNKINNYDSSMQSRHIYDKFLKLGADNSESISILHIGDSHLQAGFLSEKIKQELFTYFYSGDTIASPGFIFPFTIAQTNNPFFYKVDYSGNWSWCKNVDSEKTCKLGLSGITLRTNDSLAEITIKMQNRKYTYPVKYYFNTIKILHNNNVSQIKINGESAIPDSGYSRICLQQLTDSVTIQIYNAGNKDYFELYGLILENNVPEIKYHTIGVNGAKALSYLKCDYFSGHLKFLHPDIIILSLGTNEAFGEDFSVLRHEYELKDLIYLIRDILPETAILLITPNDHVKHKNYSNPNTRFVKDNIMNIARVFNLQVWDFYTIMGGENSIQKWYERGLTGEDKVHFRRIGYEIQGQLFTNAFIEYINNYSTIQ